MNRRNLRKRPCRICRRWFCPNPRQKDRQYTCGRAECRRERHRRNCADWHHRNPDYDRETRLRARLKQGKEAGGYVEPSQGINWALARAAIGLANLVVIDEMSRVTLDLARDAISAQVLARKGVMR